jgi:hypothetical protein
MKFFIMQFSQKPALMSKVHDMNAYEGHRTKSRAFLNSALDGSEHNRFTPAEELHNRS